MLSLLLDEQISPQAVAALRALRSDVPVVSIYTWHSGALTGMDDVLVLEAARQDTLTLVTYDLKTIPPILVEWGATARSHGGVILVDYRTISPGNFGGLARSLQLCYETGVSWDWTNRIMYLK